MRRQCFAIALACLGGSCSPDHSGDRRELSVEQLDLTGYSTDLATTDAVGVCLPGEPPTMCPSPISDTAGCGATELCGADGKGNGLDDNCNGMIDEGCVCTPGSVRSCFPGPPGKRGVGACTDGQETCQGTEFGTWGPCVGAIAPRPETCNHLDNDCNGCRGDGLCCSGVLDCPAPGDSRIPAVQPYTDLTIDGTLFFPDSGATNWSWEIHGGPCDRLFETTTSPIAQSFTVTNATTSMPTVHFTLSGDYTIKFTAQGSDGKIYTCTWVQHVNGPGVRFELCWDTTGQVDLDLHVHSSQTTTPWFVNPSGSGLTNPDDCYYLNCKAASWTAMDPARPMWGYTNSNIAECIGSPSGTEWATLGFCANPRLDMDNISTPGIPENTRR